MRNLGILLLATLTAACGEKPTAASVCQKLVDVGAATNCRPGEPGGLASAALAKADFDVPGLEPGTGQVLQFEKDSDLKGTVAAFDAMAAFAGRHRYSSTGALIFVQMNARTPAALGTSAKQIVEAL